MRTFAIGLIVVVLAGCGLIGYLAYSDQVSLKNFSVEQLTTVFKNIPQQAKNITTPQIENEKLQSVAESTSQQLQVFGERAQTIAEHTQKVLGDSVQVNEQAKEQTLHERAFEYGRYLYCKEVVEEYESTTISQ